MSAFQIIMTIALAVLALFVCFITVLLIGRIGQLEAALHNARGGDLDEAFRVLKEEREYRYAVDKPPAIGQHVMLRLPDSYLEHDFGARPGATGIVRFHTHDAYNKTVVDGVIVQWLTQGERNDSTDPESTCRSNLNELIWVRPDGTVVSPRERYTAR